MRRKRREGHVAYGLNSAVVAQPHQDYHERSSVVFTATPVASCTVSGRCGRRAYMVTTQV